MSVETPRIDPGRQRRLGLLARATAGEVEDALGELGTALSDVIDLRGPETGLVMLTGRMGGDGARFNLGEATVSRSTVRLATGEVGFGQRLGTDRDLARHIAILDAAAATADGAPVVDRLCGAIEQRLAAEHQRSEAETAATRVDFFTLVRGED